MARILVVEDDADARKLICLRLKLCLRLKRAGHVVEETVTGEGALRLLSQAEYELVTLDVMLPGISGWEVARRVASDNSAAASRILFVSIMDRDEAPQDISIRGWLAKPFTRGELNDAVEEILDDLG
ncbi:MAG: response regulator [Actinomycetota bacterium]|nr:response regulator [Actinomycetota bacterium]